MSIHPYQLKLKNLINDSVNFNVLLLGPKGIGKKTFLKNLTNSTNPSKSSSSNTTNNNNQTLTSNLFRNDNEHRFQHFNLRIHNGVNIHNCNSLIDLNAFLLDTGDRIDNSKTGQIIKQFLESKFDDVLNNEIKIQRKVTYNESNDYRIHVCVYFFDSRNDGINEVDLDILSQIRDSVNILYVIGKADKILNASEGNKEQLLQLQQRINLQLHSYNLYSFKFGTITINDIFISKRDNNNNENGTLTTEEECLPNILIDDIQPFSIICGNIKEKDSIFDNRFIWKRCYLFNKDIYIEDFESSNFFILKSILLGSHLQIFKDTTNNIIYERYRSNILLQRAEEQLKINKNNSKQNFDTIINTNTFNKSVNCLPSFYTIQEKNKIIKAYEEKFNNVNKIIKDNISFGE